MKKFKHKQTGTIGELRDNKIFYFEGISITEKFIIGSKDWIEIKEVKKSCFSKIVSVERNKDGVTFTIGDIIKINDDKAHVNLTISGFINKEIKDRCFTCITTKEINGYGDNLINIDIIKQIKNIGIMTKQCLSIQDYIDVLHENKKAFLFEGTMVKLLKEKI